VHFGVVLSMGAGKLNTQQFVRSLVLSFSIDQRSGNVQLIDLRFSHGLVDEHKVGQCHELTGSFFQKSTHSNAPNKAAVKN
jgi:hypothetical protein